MNDVSKLRRYGLAAIVCGVALAVASPLNAPSSCFFLAVMASSLYGGKGPGILAVSLSALAFYYFFLPPLFQLSAEPSSYLRFAAFLGATMLIVWLMEAKRRIEESRGKIDAQYRTVADTAPDPIISIDGNGRILFTNPAATRIFGWRASEMTGQPLTSLLPEFGIPERLSGGELIGRRKDGTEFTSEVSFGAVSGGDQNVFTGFVRDITERKRTEGRLREYEKVVEGVQDMILVVDREYRYLIANSAYLNYWGIKREQVVGHTLGEVLDKGAMEVAKVNLEECFRGKVVKCELRYKDPRLGFRDLLLSYFPIEGSKGIDRVACIFEDITERKEAETALHTLTGRILRLEDEERRRLARELHDSTAQLLAGLSMDLAVVNESAGLLGRRGREALAESVTLADQCLREIRTVSYLLHPPDLDELGLQAALTRYIDGFAQRSGIKVEVEISPDLGRLPQTVETTIFRVIQEALTNIHRHSGSGNATIRLTRGPAEIVLDVKDAGKGIPADAPLGVGIASMRERVQQLGGRLKVGSNQAGATVKAVIPLSEAAL